jgi:hypothetical protein
VLTRRPAREFLTQTGCRPDGPIAMQQSDVVSAEKLSTLTTHLTIVGSTVRVIGCHRWRQSWLGGRAVETTTPAPLQPSARQEALVDYQIYCVAALMCSRNSRAVGLRVRFFRVATATVSCCVPRATGRALSDQRLAF